MKKITIIFLILILLISSISCAQSGTQNKRECSHNWAPATCQSPSKCLICGYLSGSKGDHDWIDATCTTPKTCSVCNETFGKNTDHDVTNGHCSMCDLDYYEELIHLLQTNTTANSAGNFIYAQKYEDYTFFIGYEPKNETLYFRCFSEDDNFLDAFMLYVDKVSVKKQSYNWEMSAGFWTSNEGEISGTIDATTFSKSTNALEYGNSTFNQALMLEKLPKKLQND